MQNVISAALMKMSENDKLINKMTKELAKLQKNQAMLQKLINVSIKTTQKASI